MPLNAIKYKKGWAGWVLAENGAWGDSGMHNGTHR